MVQEPSGIMVRSSARSRSRQLAQVAQHLGLGTVRVEHRMGQKRAIAFQLGRQCVARCPARPPRKQACRRTRARPLRPCAAVVVSSSAMPSVPSRRSRRLIFSVKRAARRFQSCWRRPPPSPYRRTPRTSSAKPSLRRPAASTAVRRCTCAGDMRSDPPGRDRPHTSRR